ncbi:DUF6443 domain-containing protein [Aquimarina brevivitae]|uniref:RHS repeat-associated protein n=1 Tax=Aquimarina brevivitae TaxID=323412 RepID=A0A4Q7NTN9_9FLAO|nr:DUF6443 domain-containing protein [Aquimarina brevivitae]RZS90546.1 RHS repeat-associated protein [Aquimarina brevivitae]
MIKYLSTYITATLFFVALTITAQTPTTITKEGDYTVSGSEYLVATQSITLKPNTWIQSGSTFTASVQPDIYTPVTLSTDENYVFSRLYQRAMGSPSGIQYESDVIENVTYIDGLGRAKQQIAIKTTPDKKDIITYVAYDEYGRQAKEYLPYADPNGNGSYRTGVQQATLNYYNQPKYQNTLNPYSEKQFEPSPLNRVSKQAAPGNDWALGSGHEMKFEYHTNVSSYEVRKYKVDLTLTNNAFYTPVLVLDSYYPVGSLNKTITKNENYSGTGSNNTTVSYTDKQGKTVLKRIYADDLTYDTYYVYDDFGNLAYVLPPKAEAQTDMPTATEIAELGYQYQYDKKKRLVKKRLPGKGWEVIVYDKLNRPVLTQDANQKPLRQWSFTKYDLYNRVAYTGLYTHSTDIDQSAMQSYFINQNTVDPYNVNNVNATKTYENRVSSSSINEGTYYTNNNFPTNNIEILTLNYYDDYEIGDLVVFNPANGAGTWEGMTPVANVKGLPTVSRVKVLDTNDWVTTATYYDDKGRAWETHVVNEYLGTEDWVLNKLDFAGKVLKTQSMHSKDGQTLTTVDTYEYDHMGRLINQEQTIADKKETIVQNSYDELGQLQAKTVGGGLQTVDYTYNIRGWLTGINDINNIGDDLFTFKINYNSTETSNLSTPLYNGNISETIWKTKNDEVARAYRYNYDDLNRLTDAYFSLKSGTATTFSNIPAIFNVSGISYDKNGNILSLARSQNGYQTLMDDLVYAYDEGNKLLKVTENATTSIKDEGFKDGINTGDDFIYDTNGNMVTDNNKGISSISYNHLNLPSIVNINSTAHTGNITYIYDATGAKLRKIATEGSSVTTTDYAGNYVYKGNYNLALPLGSNNSDETVLQFFNHPEGYIEPDGSGGFEYIYQYKDHLGNIRLSYADDNKDGSIDSATEIRQEKNYYPFGLTHKGYNGTIRGRKHLYGFTGKEDQDELGLGWIDITARNYNPELGRWMNVDPLADDPEQIDKSPYAFSWNNPIRYVDPTGLKPMDNYGINSNGDITLLEKTDDNFDQLFAVNDNNEVNQSAGSVKVGKEADGSSILSQLETSNTKVEEYNDYGTIRERNVNIAVTDESNKNDVFNVFKFAADNTNVEFSVGKISYDGLGTNYQIGTFHDRNLSPGVRNSSIGNVLGLLHSHPNQPTAQDRRESIDGDTGVSTRFLTKYGSNKPYLIYFPSTQSTTRLHLPREDFLRGKIVRRSNSSLKF